MAVKGCTWLKMPGNGWNKMAENGWKGVETAGNGLKLLEFA